jgi:phi13 family phage major tail protein
MVNATEVVNKQKRGIKNVHIAPIVTDTVEKYEVGTIYSWPGARELSTTNTVSMENMYADDQLMDVRKAEGATERDLTVTNVPDKIAAMILGDNYDETTGVYSVRKNSAPVYVAIGYDTGESDGTRTYVWNYKCVVSRPDESVKTIDESTDASDTTLKITLMDTVFKGDNGNVMNQSHIKQSNCPVDLSKIWFEKVSTPDELKEQITTLMQEN